MQHGMEAISLWHCAGVMEAQVALIVAFSSSASLGLVFASSRPSVIEPPPTPLPLGAELTLSGDPGRHRDKLWYTGKQHKVKVR